MAYDVGAVVGHIRMDTSGWTRPRDAILRDVRNIGFAFTAMGGVIAAPVIKAVGEYGRFEAAMRKATSVSRVTEEQFGRMSAAAERVSVRFNIAAEEAAKGYLFLGRAGLTAEQQMMAFVPVTMAAKAMMEDLEQTAEGTVNVMNAFAIGFGETARVADVLTNVVNGTTLSLNELLVSLSYAGKPAKAFNNTLEETAAMIGLVANEGIRGSKSGTAFRFAMTALASPTAEARRIVHQLGIAVYDANGRMLPFIKIMEQLEEQFQDTGEEFRNIVLESLFGRRALPAMIALFDQGSAKVRAFTESLKRLGTTEETANKQMVAMRERMGQAVRAVQVLARHLGSALAPRVIEISRNVRDLAERWAEWVDAHGKAAGEMVKRAADIAASVVLWGALATAFTIVLGVAGRLVGVIGNLAMALVKAGEAVLVFSIRNPAFALVIAGLVAVAGMAYIIRARWDDLAKWLESLRDNFLGIFDAMKAKVGEFAEFAGDKAKDVGSALTRMIPKWYIEGVKGTFKGLGEFVNKSLAMLDKAKSYPEYSDFSEFKGWSGSFGITPKTTYGTFTKWVGTESKRTGDALKVQLEKDKDMLMGFVGDMAATLGKGFELADDKLKGWLAGQTKGVWEALFRTRDPWEWWYENTMKWAQKMAGINMDKFLVKTPFGTTDINRTFGARHRLGRMGAVADELETAWVGAIEEVSRSMKTLEELIQTVQKGLVDGWTDAFDTLMQKGSSFGEFLDSVFQGILAAFRQMVAQMAAQELFGRLTGQNMGMWRGGTEGISSLATFSSLFGFGGSKGSSGVTVPYNPAYVPAYSLPDISGALPGSGSVILNVTNKGVPVNMKQVGSQAVGKDLVVSYVMEEIQSNPEFRDIVRGG